MLFSRTYIFLIVSLLAIPGLYGMGGSSPKNANKGATAACFPAASTSSAGGAVSQAKASKENSEPAGTAASEELWRDLHWNIDDRATAVALPHNHPFLKARLAKAWAAGVATTAAPATGAPASSDDDENSEEEQKRRPLVLLDVSVAPPAHRASAQKKIAYWNFDSEGAINSPSLSITHDGQEYVIDTRSTRTRVDGSKYTLTRMSSDRVVITPRETTVKATKEKYSSSLLDLSVLD